MNDYAKGFFFATMLCCATSLLGFGLGKLVAWQHHEAIQQIGKDTSCGKQT